ncbi:MAG: type VI secretion system contractile sheath large subunit, partial [Thermodesulfobacteriota bacterium]|nr:type VI secretion system contractile sheath large subunit [Thermodesulfobacteriota bacterium]
MKKSTVVPGQEITFRILILGDFSGRANRNVFDVEDLSDRRPLSVDRDNLDEVLSRLGVEIHLSIAGNDSPPALIRFAELEDFHPDRIFERVEVFQALRDIRKKLDDPRTFASAADRVRSWTGADTVPESSEPPSEQQTPQPEISGLTTDSLLDQMLEQADNRPPETKALLDSSGWSAFLRRIVKPHLVPAEDPQQAELVASVDVATANLMRTILHHPDFQAVEAAWRAVHFLVSRLETDAELKLYLIDISKAELAADLCEAEDLRSTGIYRLLVEQTVETPGGKPWAVLAGNYTFDQTREDAELLGRMAKIARQAGAPFISAASTHLLGCKSLAETPDPDDWHEKPDTEDSQAWEELRRIPEALYLGLALPRFLLRLPYGEDTDPVEQFDFEEMPPVPDHDDYLWGNPAFACVYLWARAFSGYGWNLRPGVIRDIEGLPLHIYKEHGESKVKPCAEVVFTERAAKRILDCGIMPLLSFKDQDTIRP